MSAHPEYRVAVADLDGVEIEELPFRRLEYSFTRNAPGRISVYLPIRHPKVTESNLAPGKRVLHVYRDSVLVWGGYLWTVFATTSSEEVRLGGEGFASRLRHRYIDTTHYFDAIDQVTIAWDLINFTQNKSSGDLSITDGTTVTGVTRTIRWYSYMRKPILEAIDDLTRFNNSFDWEITPARVFKTYYTKQGSDNGVVFELGKNIQGLELTQDGTRLANTLTVLGSGSGASQLIAIGSDTTSLADYKLLEDSISATDIRTQDELQSRLTEELRVAKNLRQEPQVNAVTTDPTYDEFGVGDTVTVRADYGFLQMNDTFRIKTKTVNVSESGQELVSLEFDEEI